MADALRSAVARRALGAGVDAATREAALAVVRAGGPSVRGLVFFGSRRTAADPDPWSAQDFFVATRDYLGFYRSLHAAGQTRRHPRLLAALNAAMPPSQVPVWSRRGEVGSEGLAKCAVIDLRRLGRECGPRRSDHFCAGRLFQPAAIVWAADDEARVALVDALTSAHRETYRWARPWLSATFDAEEFCRRLLEVSMRFEIRPETTARARALFEAQRTELLEVYPLLLEELVARGELAEAGGRYRLVRPPGLVERLRGRLYFGRSLVRATLRWFKYVVTFEGWLDYILRKVERRTGQTIEVSPRERRLPLLLLWGKFYRFWKTRDRSGPEAGGGAG